MNKKINTQAGILPLIPLLVIAGILLLGGGSFAGYRVYQSHKVALVEKEDAAFTQNNADKERLIQLEEKLKQIEAQRGATTTLSAGAKDESIEKEIATLKYQNTLLKKTIQKTSPPTPVAEKSTPPTNPSPPPPASSSGLTNVALISLVKPGVVAIDTRIGGGSGILGAKNFVLTNEHVVSDVYRVNIRFSDDTVVVGYVAARNEDEDIAIISIPETKNTPLAFGDSDAPALNQGDPVYTFGFPFALSGDVSFKEGTLSRRLDFEKKKYLEISSAILPGNSGGPLVNNHGQVVGISRGGISEQITTEGTPVGESIKLAIPGNHAKQIFMPFLARAHAPTADKKKQIDDYEDYMSELHAMNVAYGDAVWQYNYALSQGSPDYFKIVSNEFGNPLALAKKLVAESPNLPFASTMRTTSYTMQQISEDMQAIAENEATRYLKSKNAQSSTLAADKQYLDKRIEDNGKKVDQYNTYLDITNKAAKEFLTYY